jgi:hypothetical protein
MSKIKFWIPTIVGALLTPIFFYAVTLSGKGPGSHAGAGMQAIFFYPLPILLAFAGVALTGAFLKQVVVAICIGIAALQFPLFGFLLGYARTKRGSTPYFLLKVAIWFHVIVSLIFLVLVFLLA